MILSPQISLTVLFRTKGTDALSTPLIQYRGAILISILLFLPGQLAHGQSIGERSLLGIDGVLVIASVSPDAEKKGLLEEDVKTNTELQLRKAGVDVYTGVNCTDCVGSPILVVLVTADLQDGLVVYSTNVVIRQDVFTIAAGGQYTEPSRATTYEVAGSVGTVGASNIRELHDVVQQHVRTFINDWLSVQEE